VNVELTLLKVVEPTSAGSGDVLVALMVPVQKKAKVELEMKSVVCDQIPTYSIPMRTICRYLPKPSRDHRPQPHPSLPSRRTSRPSPQ
jgi:hypothetical protein